LKSSNLPAGRQVRKEDIGYEYGNLLFFRHREFISYGKEYRGKNEWETDLHTFNELIPLADRSFQYDEKCNGCGICTRINPLPTRCKPESEPTTTVIGNKFIAKEPEKISA